MQINNKSIKADSNSIDDDGYSPSEKLDHIAGVFHEQIDDIVMQLNQNMMVDEDLLPFNLLRRVILMTINVYGFEDVKYCNRYVSRRGSLLRRADNTITGVKA